MSQTKLNAEAKPLLPGILKNESSFQAHADARKSIHFSIEEDEDSKKKKKKKINNKTGRTTNFYPISMKRLPPPVLKKR